MSYIASIAVLGGGFVWPAYQSVQCIESSVEKEKTRLLKYWAVFGLFYFVTSLLDFILRFIPLYHYLHAAFIIALATQEIVQETAFELVAKHAGPVKKQVMEVYESTLKKVQGK